MILLFAALVSIEFFVFAYCSLMFYNRSRSTDIFRRLRRHYAADSERFKKTEDIVLRIYKLIKRAAKPFTAFNATKKLDFALKQAGLPLFGAEFIIVTIICIVLGSSFSYVITMSMSVPPLIAIAIPILFWIGIRILVDRRRKAFTEQLGDCLTTVANALRAGYSFQQAMDVVAKEMEPPMSTEFERVSTDVAMGVSLEEALEQMNKRLDSSDFDLVVTAVLIQREIGGNLAQILDTISETINERIRMKREISALTAQGRFSAWVLLLLPFVVAAFCWVFNHDQMLLFVTERAGQIALAAVLLMEFIGFVIIQRIVDIEV